MRRLSKARRSHETVRPLHDTGSPSAVSCLQRFKSGSTLYVRISVEDVVPQRQYQIDSQRILRDAARPTCLNLFDGRTTSISMRELNLAVVAAFAIVHPPANGQQPIPPVLAKPVEKRPVDPSGRRRGVATGLGNQRRRRGRTVAEDRAAWAAQNLRSILGPPSRPHGQLHRD